mmetsp:Transcript_644/g.866  ORF Transcript_644/g.866 Transcript_644/m.866 type:complete len:202 (-) Transcript_644:135-740(-)
MFFAAIVHLFATPAPRHILLHHCTTRNVATQQPRFVSHCPCLRLHTQHTVSRSFLAFLTFVELFCFFHPPCAGLQILESEIHTFKYIPAVVFDAGKKTIPVNSSGFAAKHGDGRSSLVNGQILDHAFVVTVDANSNEIRLWSVWIQWNDVDNAAACHHLKDVVRQLNGLFGLRFNLFPQLLLFYRGHRLCILGKVGLQSLR